MRIWLGRRSINLDGPRDLLLSARESRWHFLEAANSRRNNRRTRERHLAQRSGDGNREGSRGVGRGGLGEPRGQRNRAGGGVSSGLG